MSIFIRVNYDYTVIVRTTKATFQVLTAASMTITVFWDPPLMEAVSTSETSVNSSRVQGAISQKGV
jgi:hypothetical protein